MKRIIAILSILSVVIAGLTACSDQDIYDKWRDAGYNTGYEHGWNDGFDNGFDDGLLWGAIEGQDDIASEVISQYEKLEGEISKEYGLHPEDAMIILEEYMNGEKVSEEDLHAAIKAIRYFYYQAWNVIYDIEKMDVDYDFD